MNNPFDDDFHSYFDDLSNAGSITTNPKSQYQYEGFYKSHKYIKDVLSSWNIQLGDMLYNPENHKTIMAFMELISWRQKDLINRQKTKEEISKLQFDRDKYRSLLQQAKRTIQEKDKNIGRLENILSDYSAKAKVAQSQAKKSKEQDKKSIAMLKSKNEQILHQLKKKDLEIVKVTQQLKKNTKVDRSISTNSNGKVTFQVNEKFTQQKSNPLTDQIQYLTDKFDNQKRIFLRQNLLLKQKIYDIRQQIVQFAQWIEFQIFGITKTYQNSFIVNHNLLFKKQSIVTQLKQLIQNAKNGIIQIQYPQQLKNQISKLKGNLNNQNTIESKNIKQVTPNTKKIKQDRYMKKITIYDSPVKQNYENKQKQLKKQPPYIEQRSFSQLLNQIDQSELSIISHVSLTDLQKRPFDKWDILFPKE